MHIQAFTCKCIYRHLNTCAYVQLPLPLELAFEPRPTASQAAEELGAEGIVFTASTQFKFCKGAECLLQGQARAGGRGTQDKALSLNLRS